jgi:hypothetical protein
MDAFYVHQHVMLIPYLVCLSPILQKSRVHTGDSYRGSEAVAGPAPQYCGRLMCSGSLLSPVRSCGRADATA